MYRYTEKIVSALLLASMLSVVSCASAGDKTNETTKAASDTSASAATETEATGRDAVKTDLPDNLNFGGKTVTVLSRSDKSYAGEFLAEEENGDVMNDAVYKRNTYVEDKLNVSIKVMTRPGAWGEHTQFNSDLKKEVMAGSTEYDVISYYAYPTPMLATEGVLYNLYNLEYVDFTKPWWRQMFIENASVYGKLYSAAGDMAYTSVSNIDTMFFNKNLAADYVDYNLYDTVRSGDWTLDKFFNTVKDIYKDLDGDSTKSDKDFYGFDANICLDQYAVGSGITYTKRTDDGGYDWNYFTERNTNIIDGFFDKIQEKGIYYVDDDQKTMFRESRCVFYSSKLEYTEQLRDMKDDYGILPMPKYDGNQENYYSVANDNSSLISVPATCGDPELVGAFIELMSEQSYKTVIPAYFETAMKGKYLRDDDSSQMFDLIIDSAWYDFAVINTSVIGDPVFITRNAMQRKTGNFSSYYASHESELKQKMTDLLEIYKNA